MCWLPAVKRIECLLLGPGLPLCRTRLCTIQLSQMLGD